ncbi:alpha/beta fold hydrolase [Thalassococcus sp. S3]|uniref:alpha/beta fold hydrolase n=1 Tax=Thalassococcus sp. S3 TaxID=2017482 RepID=UPI0010240E0A|nr:alpha/beta fold hydrolase [Thalassococcus sp. S3]QBF33493.1 alpha/beta hydrolase [Thalassococcus sp. S3]
MSPKETVIDGRRVCYADANPTHPRSVVLLHGGGLDSATLSWGALLPDLAKDARVLAPDLPGHGGSDGFERPFTITDLSDWLSVFLKTCDIARADLVGVSMGGGTALSFALSYPARVRSVVAVGSYGVQARMPSHGLSWVMTRINLNRPVSWLAARSALVARGLLAQIFADPARLTPSLVALVQEAARRPDQARAFHHFQLGELHRDGLKTDLTDQLPNLKCPVLFVHGKADRLVPLKDIEHAVARIPQGRLTVMDAGHWPMRECPEAFNAAALGFLREVDTKSDVGG